jgi:hypothetical protein
LAIGAIGLGNGVAVIASLRAILHSITAVGSFERQLAAAGGIAAGTAHHSIRALRLGHPIAVIARLVRGRVLDAIATRLVGAAVFAAAITGVGVPVVADLPLVSVKDAIAAGLSASIRRPSIGSTAVRRQAARVRRRVACIRHLRLTWLDIRQIDAPGHHHQQHHDEE